MKSVVILYESNSKYALEQSFDEFSGKQLCSLKLKGLFDEENIIKVNNCNTVSCLISSLKNICNKRNADYVVFSYDDLPFIDCGLTEKLIKSHENYNAEYTYSDGYSYGFAPEIISRNALEVLSYLAENTHREEGQKAVARDSIYNLIKTEINSFDVEAVLAEEDWRLLRLAFHCVRKENYLACKALYKEIKDKKDLTVDKISEIASVTPSLLKTVPGFYNIQVSDFTSYDAIYTPYNRSYEEKYKVNPMEINPEDTMHTMSLQRFSELIDKIALFSGDAVISLSLWGEAFSHRDILKMIEKVLSYQGLSVYIETDGYNITDEICKALGDIVNKAEARTNGWNKLMIAVSLDSVSQSKYNLIHRGCREDGMEKAISAICKLSEVIPDSVYPQFIRMDENEDELEKFFRYWNDKSSHSNGNLIVQNYDDFCGMLFQRKPADLSPLVRNPCWHIRRDLTILTNGDVPLCRSYVLSNIVGNVFNQSLEDIWGKLNDTLVEHINKTYNEKCGKCDEYYTFNF